MDTKNNELQDAVVEANRQLLLDRSRVGISKYGVTLAESGLSRAQLAQHALEEALDLANYLQTIIMSDAAPAQAKPAGEVLTDDLLALQLFVNDLGDPSVCQALNNVRAALATHSGAEVPSLWQGHHPDDAAVRRFAAAMMQKMAASRAKGRYGWDDETVCPTERLQSMLLDHLAKGDPLDVANFCMMLWTRGAPVVAQHASKEVPSDWRDALADACIEAEIPDSKYESLCIALDAALKSAAAPIAAPTVRYTCKGKGGEYDLIGVAYGAGTSRGSTVNLYRETATGVMYYRPPADFQDRMERIEAAAPIQPTREE